jgi:hypothetical protein
VAAGAGVAPNAGGGVGIARIESGGVAPKAVLAEVVSQAAPLTVQVVAAQRVTADTVRVEIALINTSRGPEPLDVVRALTGRQAAALTPADLCLLTADGGRRLFVLRDAANAPLTGGGFEPLQPGERRVVWAMFPSPGPASTAPASAAVPAAAEMPRVNVVLAGIVLRNVPIAPVSAES